MVEVRRSSKLHSALAQHASRGHAQFPRLDPILWKIGCDPLAGQTLVVAIEERTCLSLTLVFRLRPIAGLRNRFTEALRQTLQGCGVSPGATERECTAVHAASFVRRRHPALVEALEFAQSEGLSHAELGQDEASVQDMLNGFLYGGCPASCPRTPLASCSAAAKAPTCFAGRMAARAVQGEPNDLAAVLNATTFDVIWSHMRERRIGIRGVSNQRLVPASARSSPATPWSSR